MGNKPPRLRCIGPLVPTMDTRSAKPPPKEVDGYYRSPEHRAWAEEGARLAQGRCQDPRCKAPDRVHERLFADHIQELKDEGAALDPKNRMMRCGSCHTRKTVEARAARMAR
jgi:5-methylcytosine-specific restriction protein A